MAKYSVEFKIKIVQEYLNVSFLFLNGFFPKLLEINYALSIIVYFEVLQSDCDHT